MRKFLTTGLFSAILGIVISGAPADAALVSRGFLDEALENYATTTALDLKANQSDFTDLSDKIGTLPEGITLENFYKGWVDSGGESMAKYIATQGGKGMVFTYDPVENVARPEGASGVGYLDVLASLIDQEGFVVRPENSVLAPFWYLTKQALRVGEIPRDKTVAGMIDEINTKIGTLPDGLTVQAMYDGWTDSEGVIHKGLNDLSTITNNIDLSVEASIAALMGYESGHKTRVTAVLNQLFMPIPEHPNFVNLSWHILEGNTFPKFAQEKYGIPGYKGLVDLTKAVGDLPSGNLPENPDYEDFFSTINQPLTYPTSLAELITAIYGNSETGSEGLLSGIITGYLLDSDQDGRPETPIGLLSNFVLARNAEARAITNTAKIGTLPDGYETVGAALTAIKGIAEDAKAAALAAIPDPKTEGSTGKFVLTVDIVGDNATYRWEKIDREGETTTTE